MLPLRNGFEVCQKIRENPAWKDMKIVMLTAKGRAVEVSKGLALGADAYITKPFAIKELLANVQRGAATTVLYAVWSTLQPAQQVLLAAGFADSLGLVIVLSALLVATLGVVLHEIFRQYVVQPRRLAEETFLILSANTGHRITCSGPREMAELGDEAR